MLGWRKTSIYTYFLWYGPTITVIVQFSALSGNNMAGAEATIRDKGGARNKEFRLHNTAKYCTWLLLLKKRYY